MASNVEIGWTSSDAGVLKTLQNIDKGLAATARRLEQVEDTSRKATATTKRGLDEGAGAATKFAGALAGVAMAAAAPMAILAALKAEYQALIDRQRQSMLAQQGAGESLREVRKVFTPDRSMGADAMETRLLDIATRRGSNVATVSAAAATAFSAKGSLTNEQAASAIEAAVRMAPTNATEAATLAGRYQDIMKSTGIGDARSVAGWLTRVQQGSRISTMAGVGQNAVPAITSLVAGGDTPEQAAEIFNTISQLMADQEGSLSRTAAINLGVQLKKFLPDVAGGTQGRIAALQADPRLRAGVMGKMSFDAASGNFVKALLSGDRAAVAAYGAAQAAVPTLNAAQAAAFEQQIEFIEGGRFDPVVNAKQQNAANIEGSRLARGLGGRRAQAREILSGTLTEIDLAGPDLIRNPAITAGFDVAASRSANPERIAAGMLQVLLDANARGLVTGGVQREDQSLVMKQIQLLERIAETNERMAREASSDPPRVRPLPSEAVARPGTR